VQDDPLGHAMARQYQRNTGTTFGKELRKLLHVQGEGVSGVFSAITYYPAHGNFTYEGIPVREVAVRPVLYGITIPTVPMLSDMRDILISIANKTNMHPPVAPEYPACPAPRADAMEHPAWWAEAHRLRDRGMDALEICRWMPSLSYDQVSSAFGIVAVADAPPPDATISPEHWLKVADYRGRGYDEDKILRYLPSLTRGQVSAALVVLSKREC